MKAVIQRVTRASVRVDGQVIAEIGEGLLILVGIGHADESAGVIEMAEKIAVMRIFEDQEGKTNLSVLDIGGEALVVSQFTLYADTRRGRRPGFTDAARPEIASPLVDLFAQHLDKQGVPTQKGRFGAEMDIELVNAGPMTILLEQ